jgi:lysophospholipase L1-like esterase
MKSDFTKSVITTITLMLGLFGLAALSSVLPTSGAPAYARELIAQAGGRHSFGGEEANGYYENLMQGRSSRVGSLPIERIILSKSTLEEMREGSIYLNGGFLLFQARPNLNVINTVEGPVQTNSYGFFDREFSLEKPPGTRRIALLGDSVTRGWGVNANQRYGNLLEDKLNAEGKNFQVLNFATPGYMLTQTFDVVQEKAVVFHPDVYLLAMTDITAGLEWGSHVVQLVDEGQDLKYDLLRGVVKESGISKTDSSSLDRWKLVPYRQSTMQQIFLQIKAFAEQHSAKVIVVFVPSAQDQDELDSGFRPLRASLANTGIPIIDLSKVFEERDIERLRRNWHDIHPTWEGHQIIADNLYSQLRTNPEAWAAITGTQEPSKGSTRK